jgi:hypothetical protein
LLKQRKKPLTTVITARRRDALKVTLEEQEKSLLESKAALKEREEFLEASENKLFDKFQAQQEREIELEQWAEELGEKESSLKPESV